ncbi:MAG: T9SS type A sorting domain-containing protein, partial [Flavobacteriales bacterium]|nr:T9SS type A sorting domain-containing protein [Flavobacteriales bacterium]
QLISTIILKPDSNKWLALNQGMISQTCDTGQSIFSCQNGDAGAFQVFPFQSDPIQLKGTPPAGGWTFFWSDYARPYTDNGPSGSLGLRATMYPIKKPNTSSGYYTTDQCQDNSPRFALGPKMLFCRGLANSLNFEVKDLELDSLSYHWDKPLTSSPTSFANYTSPYTYDNPFPDTSFDARNSAGTIDPITGTIHFATYSGSGYTAYTNVVRIDAYRYGERISSVFRDVPIGILDCPLPTGQTTNTAPVINYLNSNTLSDTMINVIAGEVVEVSFSLYDRDSVYSQSPPFQQIYMEPSGYMFSTNFARENQCDNPLIVPCATLNPPPIKSAGKPYLLSGSGGQGISTTFRWQTTCGHLFNSSDNSSIINFVLRTYDDFCPVPSAINTTISVRVNAKGTLEAAVLKGASVEFDGKITLNWVPPIDSAYSFSKYDMQAATSNNGTQATSFLDVQTNVKKYKQELSFPFLNFGPNLWTPIPGSKDYYFRMRTKSGCSEFEPSTYSEVVRVMEIESYGIGNINPIDTIRLTWNAPKASNAQSPNYYVYESPTRYYIWQNDDPHNSITDLSKWYLRGSTNSKTIDLVGNLCGLVGFRIEARDTVITIKQGSGLKNPQYDTLTFSSFSIVGVQNMNLSNPLVLDKYLVSLSANYNSPNLQWFDCNTNSNISGETNHTFIPLDTGKYAFIIDNGNCKDTSSCFIVDELLDNTVSQITNQQLRSNGANQLYQWIDCRADTIIPGAINRDFIPQDTGYYAVVVSAYGYSDTSSCIPMLAIGILENRFESELSLYPNPSSGLININSNFIGIKKITIRNIKGQIIDEKNYLNNREIRFNLDCTKGIYFFEIEAVSGMRIFRKVVKH